MSELDSFQSPGGASGRETVASPTPPPAAPPPPRRRSRVGVFFFGAFSGCLLVFVALFLIAVMAAAMSGGDERGDYRWGSTRVAILPIDGEIVDARDAIEMLHRYARNTVVRAIIVRVNSPGGAIAPSQEIYEEIRKTRVSSGKPIIASLDSVAASGGFYIASACDEIMADPGSITGSIGVIMQWVDVKDLLNWAKLKPETITSGEMKAAGSPMQDLTDSQRAYFQRIVMQLRQQFVHAVAEGRKGKMSEAQVNAIADGRVFTGEEAMSLKLIDRLGNLDDAIARAGHLGRIVGAPAVIYPKRRKGGLLDLFSDSNDAESMIQRIVSRPAARFLYRWQAQ